MHAASAPRAPYALGARGLAARGRAPSRYRRRAADARAKISGEGRDADSDAREAICSAREDEGAAETPTSTRQACVSRASTAFVAAATAATLALGASAPAPPSARFLRAEAAESAVLRPEVEAALVAERERDRRAAERVVDAFLALSREDQVKVVDRLVFAADADRRAAAATGASVEPGSVSVVGDAPETETSPAEDPFSAADARDGWPARFSDGDDGDDRDGASERASRAVSDDPFSLSLFDDGETSTSRDADAFSAPSSASARAGEAVTAGARTAAATAALRLYEAAPEARLAETFETFKSFVRDGAFPFPGVPSDAGAPLALAGLVALAMAPEIGNALAGDAGDGDATGDDGELPDARAATRDAGVRRVTGSTPADGETPREDRVLWSRRDGSGPEASISNASADGDRGASASRSAPSASPSAGGVLWTRAEDDAAAARRRESRNKNARRSPRSGGRNGLGNAPTRERRAGRAARDADARDGGSDGSDGSDGSGRTSFGPPAVSLGRGLGPVEDENMENVRFAPRK